MDGNAVLDFKVLVRVMSALASSDFFLGSTGPAGALAMKQSIGFKGLRDVGAPRRLPADREEGCGVG